MLLLLLFVVLYTQSESILYLNYLDISLLFGGICWIIYTQIGFFSLKGPCLEYLLQHKILDTLHTLGRADVGISKKKTLDISLLLQ